MAKQKIVIFDLDGTLFNTETVDVPAFNDALSLHGYPRRSKDEILAYIGAPLREIAVGLLDTEDEQTIQTFCEDVISFETKWIEKAGQLYEGVLPFLYSLKSKNMTLCICTNGNKVYVHEIAQKFQFNHYFDEIVYKKEGVTKEQAVTWLIQKYGTSSQFVMVGDRTNDFVAARHNKIPSIGVTYGYGKQEVEEADYIASRLEEVEKWIDEILTG